MNLCKDCKHRFGWFYDKCRKAPPSYEVTSPVTGETSLRGNNSCVAQRIWNREDYCGPEGKNWEQKT